MESILTFVIPVRHPDNCQDWGALKTKLNETVRSISSQEDGRWRAMIVANSGSDLPDLPPQFSVKYVDYGPNKVYDISSGNLEAVYQAVRLDKGRRILAGLIEAKPSGHVMLVDDDDFVSRRLTGFVAKNPAANGWYFKQGYVWSDGGSFLYKHNAFWTYCGTSHIVRADLYKIPPQEMMASNDYISSYFGSHISITNILRDEGTPLEPLPFTGAIYRIGHGSHSQSRKLFQTFFGKHLLKQPIELVRRFFALRPLSRAYETEFGMRPLS